MQRWTDFGLSCELFAIPLSYTFVTDGRVRQKSEDNLAMAESELDKHTNLVTDLTKKIDELQVKADEATRLKDQVDEYEFLFLVRLINDLLRD